MDQGADPMKANKKGQTPLAAAEERGHEKIVAMLKEAIRNKEM